MKIVNLSLIAIMATSLFSCINENSFDPSIINKQDSTVTNDLLSELNVAPDFNFATSKSVKVSLVAPSFLNSAVFDLYTKRGNEDSLAIGSGTFDANGRFTNTLTLSQRADSVLIYSKSIGLVSGLRLPITNNTIDFDYRPLYERATTAGKQAKALPKVWTTSSKSNSVTFTYLDTYDTMGVPNNMATPDVIEQSLLDDINTSLPENVRGGVPTSSPEFLAGTETQLILTEVADVWVTFVAEGAGHRNALGYYSYPVGEEPESVDDINHNIIFANASMKFSGGGLVPGDKVLLGRFDANTVISWFLVADGWKGSGVDNVNRIYYSQSDFNPESTPEQRQHMVMLHDSSRDFTVLGFEDLYRGSRSDDDFNDAVFYATANPPTAIQAGNMAKIKLANDTDEDGVIDTLDDYPLDPNKAFNNFSPSENSKGIIAFEDLWPYVGDYDFNDLVVGYNYNLIANGNNMVTTIDAKFSIEQIGAAYKNGFGITMPINPELVESIEGQVLNGGYEEVSSNGTETTTATKETVILIAGNTKDMKGDSIAIRIKFNTAIAALDFGKVPFNPFLIVDGNRKREVHLPNLAPTSKAEGFLGTNDDVSDFGTNLFYKTDGNLPWAIDVYEGFVPPAETVPISTAYPRFANWANSSGQSDKDWFKKD